MIKRRFILEGRRFRHDWIGLDTIEELALFLQPPPVALRALSFVLLEHIHEQSFFRPRADSDKPFANIGPSRLDRFDVFGKENSLTERRTL
ncbi:hypothetical protein [Bradyrhizobium sp. CCGUVB23]|uniref:hypothetical protein n=1 Tax=Bradyrhizobium sp. CCGUVB23 TaxID=2949630 RepID=UPI0020B30491|nr:hypothetical protein [Bradyrhizobium sp. CCGUVB23]MCP3460859.1 hypothetical protein [Bradyrhizobium sp. CCGUVB23]